MASVVTPVLLGVCVGALVSGRIGATGRGSFVEVFVTPWLTPFAFSVGIFALVLFAFLAAVYLTVEARDDALREDFRRRAILAAVAVFGAALLVLLLSEGAAPLVRRELTTAPWAIPLHVMTGVTAVTAIWALWTRHWRTARLAAAAQVSLILWGWAFAQFPYLVPPDITIADAAAPHSTLRLILWALAVGGVILFPSLYYLFRVFKGEERAFERLDR